MDQMKLQTLQIYKKVEKIPVDVRIKRMSKELESIRLGHPVSYFKFEHDNVERALQEPPHVKSIEFQDILTKIEKELSGWIMDYREMIQKQTEIDRTIPKDHHELKESDDKAKENVDKIIKVLEIKDRLLDDFRSLCIRYEDDNTKLRRNVRQLQSQLVGSQSRIENLEYALQRAEKRH